MNKKDTIKGIIAFTLYFVLSGFQSLFFTLIGIDLSKLNTNQLFILNIIYQIIIIFITILIFKNTFINNLKEYKNNIKLYLSKYIKYWFIALGLMYLSNFIIIIINGQIAANEQSVRELFNANPVLTFILASFLAPLLEELIFRLSLYKILNKYPRFYILISGLFFGFMHIIGTTNNILDYLYLIPYSIPGCIFAYTLVKSKNIFVPISLHFIHNTFALIIQLVSLLQ